MRGWVRKVSGAVRNLYIGLALFDAAGANITGDGSQWSYAAAGGVTSRASFTKYPAAYRTVTGTAVTAQPPTPMPFASLYHRRGSPLLGGEDS